jgi:methyl-accepting chemotaxis protein
MRGKYGRPIKRRSENTLLQSIAATYQELAAKYPKLKSIAEAGESLEQLEGAASDLDRAVSRAQLSLEKVKTAHEAFEAAIADWEKQLDSIGDDAQLANVDLQNILQKQQQTLQMMSNISKMLHDTAQAVIRKMGG